MTRWFLACLLIAAAMAVLLLSTGPTHGGSTGPAKRGTDAPRVPQAPPGPSGVSPRAASRVEVESTAIPAAPDADALAGAPRSAPARWVRGRVLEWSTREPVPGLRVAPSTGDGPTAISDAEGVFELLLDALGLPLEAEGEGWSTVRRAEPDAADALGFTLVLVAPSERLSGRVRDPGGQGLAEVRVRFAVDGGVWREDPAVVALTRAVTLEAATDPEGRFELERVPQLPGRRLQLEKAGYERRLAALPDSVQEPLELVLQPQAPPAVLFGSVVHLDGAGAPFARVECGGSRVRADARGHFELTLRGAGPVADLVATLGGFGEARLARDELTSRRAVELRLGPPTLGIAGRVVSTAGERHELVRVALFPVPETSDEPLRVARLQSDGRFSFEGLAAGRYALWVVAEGSRPACVRAEVDAGAVDVEVVVPSVGELDALSWAVLRGDVRDRGGRFLPGAALRSGPLGTRAARGTTTRADGSFELRRVRGPWTLVAVSFAGDDLDPGSFVRVLGPSDARDGVTLRSP